MQVEQAILTKRAVRFFSAAPISEEMAIQILKAGRHAQSAKNQQPWDFIAIRERELLVSLSKCGKYAGHLAGAALGVAILTPDPDQRWSIMFDAGQAAAYMQLFAWEKGIASCLATIYQPEEARGFLNFPADRHLNVAISFGYPQDPQVLSTPPHGPGRRSEAEVFHYDRW
jgi:nitroreductase